MGTRRDVGETLIEIMFTIVIVGLSAGALLSSLATVGRAGNSQRIGVIADVALRGYAEAIKAGAQVCTAGATYTVSYSAPVGFTSSVQPSGNSCPPVDSPQLLTLTVAGPLGVEETMQIKVGTP